MSENELDIIVTTDQAAKFFEVTRKTLKQWSDAGAPKVNRGRWNLKELFDWWWTEIASDRAAQQGGDESMNEAKRRYWWQKYEGERIKNERERGRLIARDDVAREWAWRVAEVANGLSAMAKRLPPLLEGKTQGEMLRLIEDEVWKMRNNYTRTGQFCPAEVAREALEGSGEGSQPAKQTQGKKKTGSKSRTGQKTRSTTSTDQSRYGKTTSTRSKGKKGSSKQ
jgi:phage terminase Nu1 subunit (DNA packaging protein)